MHGEHPSLGSGDEVGVLQLLGVSIFGYLQGFSNGSLAAFCGGCSGMHFGELHVLPSIDLGFFSSMDALPQLGGLLVVLLLEGQQVGGHVLHARVIFLSLQGFHASDPGLDGSSPGVGRISWVYRQWSLHRSNIGVVGLCE
jgi:hypothetical protein